MIERVQSDPTAFWWYYGYTAAQIGQALQQTNSRIVDIQVESVSDSGPVFTVCMVSNTGAYAKEWWWWFGSTAQQVGQKLQELNARLISISPYQSGSDLLFATVMVSNTGSDAKAWWWYYGTFDFIASSLKPLNARVVDLENYVFNGATNYAAIAIADAGADASAWWWYYNVPASTVGNVLSQNSAQLLTFVNDQGNFDATIQGPSTSEWWYYFGFDSKMVGNLLSQNGARPTQVRSYFGPGGARTFDVVMINNSNALSTRIGNLERSNGGGWSGFYLKEVNGPVLGALNDGWIFEPASAIKIVMAVYTMTQVQNGTATLNDWVEEFDPHNFCSFQQLSLGTGDGRTVTFSGALPQNYGEAIDAGSVKVTAGTVAAIDNGSGNLIGTGVSGTVNYVTGDVSLTYTTAPANGAQLLVFETKRAAIKQMMWNSDNARADMFIHLYGPAVLTAFAASIGMPNTQVNWYVDCAGGKHNQLTLDDAAHLYEGLATGTLLTPANVQTLFSLMAGKDYDFSGTWGALQKIIQQVAPTNLTPAQIQSFTDGIQLSYKPGGYTYGPTVVDPDGSTAYSDVGLDGWVQIPFCNGTSKSSKQYVFGFFFEQTSATGPTGLWAAIGSGAEILREQVTAALATWAQCG